MSSFSRRSLNMFVRLVWGTTVFAVITLAVCVQLGRSAFPYLDDYKGFFESYLASPLNTTLVVGHISASWDGLRPAITLEQVRISGGPYAGEMYAERLSAEVNLLATFTDWRLALGQLHFDGLRAELRQAEDGTWDVVGLPQSKANNNNFTIDDPLDIFLFGRRLELKNTELAFAFRTGHRAEMVIPSVTLENDEDFHRLKAKISVDDDTDAFYFVLEGEGDPRNNANFTSKGYLHLNRFPLQKVVAATGLNKGLDIKPGLWSEGSRMDTQLWFSGSMQKGVEFGGWAKATGLPFELPGNAEAPSVPQFNFRGQWSKAEGFMAQMSQLGLSWPVASAPPLDIQVSAGVNRPAELRVRELNVGAWGNVLEALKLDNPIAHLQQSLKPSGVLRNIGVTLTTPEEGYFTLLADVDEGAVDSWQGAPEIHHATGFVETSAFKGRMVIAPNEGFVMHYPMVYKKPLTFYQAEGEVAWFVDLPNSMVYVTSGLLKLKGESGEGAGYLSLDLPIKHIEGMEPEMTLIVGMRESVARYHDLYIPYIIPDSLYNWLGQSIKDGGLTNGAFIYRGSLLASPLRPRSLQLSMDVHRGELAFDPAWPSITNANAALLVDDFAVKVAINDSELMGNRLHGGLVELVKTPAGKMALSITGLASGKTENALALLRHSPVQKVAGDALAQFEAKGNYVGSVELLVPIEGDWKSGWQEINAKVHNNQFSLPELGLDFDQVNGDIRYHSEQGLSAPNLTARLWRKPVTGILNTQADDQGRILQLGFKGDVEVTALHSWLKQPLFNYLDGTASVNGELTLPFDHPRQGIALNVSSTLKGVAVNFPAPYAKVATAELPIELEYRLPRNSHQSQLRVTTANGVHSDLRLESSHLLALDIGFNEPAKAKLGNMRLHGQLDTINVKDWGDFVTGYLDAQQASSAKDPLQSRMLSNGSPYKAPVFSMALRAKKALLSEFEVNDVALWARELPDSWYFDVETPLAVANYQRFFTAQPSRVHFDYLHIPAVPKDEPIPEEPVQNKVSLLADIALEHLEPMDVTIDELALGSEGLGHIAFNYRPEGKGLIAKKIRGTLRGLQSTNGTLALYKRGPKEWESSFSGTVSANNLGDVLKNFGLPVMITSESATANVSLNWPGYPDQLQLNHLSGTVDLAFKRGRFVQGEEGGDAAGLKLISLLNFDTLVRRLSLDFSDLSAEGLAYDNVSGRLFFEHEKVRIPAEAPLVVDTTSADLQLVGDIDLTHQTIDSQLIATLPIAGNLAVAAALTAGLPAALGVYVVGKLFKRQMDNLASVRYNVTGSWEKPKLEVDRIFEKHAQTKAPNTLEDDPATAPAQDMAPNSGKNTLETQTASPPQRVRRSGGQ